LPKEARQKRNKGGKRKEKAVMERIATLFLTSVVFSAEGPNEEDKRSIKISIIMGIHRLICTKSHRV
jgi:hypothetical protein